MIAKSKVLQYLEIVSSMLPIPISWLDVNSVILGINEPGLKAIGTTREACVGKTLYDIYPQEMADHIKHHDEKVVREGVALTQEESIVDATTHEVKYFTTFKAPLYNEYRNIVGLVVIGIDITAEKKAKNLLKRAKILKYLGIVASILPAPIYWEDINNVVLGGNEKVFKGIGALSKEALIGKTAYDLYPKEIAEHIIQHNEQVMRTGKILSQEEVIKDITTGEIKYFTAVKAPLRDDDGNIIGIVGTSIDITAEKGAESVRKRTKILEHLDMVASILPAPIYWEDVNSVILGGNEAVFKGTGALTREAYVGKTLYELYPKEMADHIKFHNEEVMRKGEILSQEEAIKDISTGEIKYFTAVKAPLRDDDGNIIGIIGTSVDITAEKEAEHLKLENAVHKNLAQEQKKFVKIANQVAHDIRSPLASLLMIVKSCAEIPETDRIALREAAIGIGDIANHLLNQYQKKEQDSETDDRKPILISAVLMQLLTEKKYQYQNLAVKFDSDFTQNSHFSFIKISSSAFKRMISNLINNAVDAFDKNKGKVDLKLDASTEWVKITIQDNGKGMPVEVIDKIMSHIAVTAGKKSGHGIGLTQVQETLQHNQGELAIDSKLGKGTKITLTFPRIKTPHWIAEEIVLGKQDTIVILDDDTSIHGAWDAHFEPVLKKTPTLQLRHFTIGNEALSFIESLSENQKENVFLLTDYELLKQELNGLHVIAKSGVKRSILVTSHYAQQIVQNQAAKTGTKVLPKQLASEIPIKISEVAEPEKQKTSLQSVDLILVDDDEKFVQNLIMFVFTGKTIDKYYDPYHFLENVSKYAKNTRIFLDNNFAVANLRGLDIAKKLHEQGFTRLYILSGEVFEKNQIPDYVTVIRKDDVEGLQKI